MPSHLAWRLLDRSGLARLHRRARQRRTLTVVAFHRVLPEHDARWFGADPDWTMPVELFRECLMFFKRHYAPVGLERVLGARERDEPLPDHALLLTFDDGWADTAEVALPVLSELRVPAAVFVASSAIGRVEPFWEERVFAAWSEGRLSPTEADRLWREAADDGAAPPASWGEMSAVRALVARLEALEDERRAGLFAARGRMLEQGPPAAMLSHAQLDTLRAAGIHVGAHGRTHRPLTRVADPEEELRGARRELAELTGASGSGGPVAFSFPHGRSTPELEQLALASGYRLLFTSEEHLNRCGPRGPDAVLGRIPIDGRELVDARGRFRPELLTRWLSARPVRGGKTREFEERALPGASAERAPVES